MSANPVCELSKIILKIIIKAGGYYEYRKTKRNKDRTKFN